VEVNEDGKARLIKGGCQRAADQRGGRRDAARQQEPQCPCERVAVEHTLAHVGQWQGRRARYRGVRKNLFDLRRCAVVHNVHALARSQQLSAELQEAA
jgi:hypothetical protein